MRDYNCWKCGDQTRVPEKTKLIGGYGAKLCTQCCNEFHEFILPTPEWKALQDTDARLAVAVEQADETKTVRLNQEKGEILEKLFYIGKAWCPAPIPEPKKGQETNAG